MYGCMHEGYTACVASTASYYRANMEALEPANWEELFMQNGFIFTKSKDGVPVQYKETAHVQNSLVANGCVIYGEVENSILFRGVTVAPGVKIRNSIIMEKCSLEDNVLVENGICDKNVVITEGARRGGFSAKGRGRARRARTQSVSRPQPLRRSPGAFHRAVSVS